MKLLRLTVCLVCLGGASSVAAERLTLDHVAKIVNVSNPRMSPDGKNVVIAVSRANLKDNRFDTQLVLVNVATRAQKILTRRQATATSGRRTARGWRSSLPPRRTNRSCGSCRWTEARHRR